jgi:hypothetical protein
VNAHYPFAGLHKLLKSGFLSLIENGSGGTHQNHHIELGKILISKLRGILGGVYRKHVFLAHFFQGHYPIGNGLVSKSSGFGKNQYAKLSTLLGEGSQIDA